jgi:AraC-like DNA-binding protein
MPGLPARSAKATVDNAVVSALSPSRPAPAQDSLMFARYLLGAAAACGADARQLARDAGLPAWALNAGRAMLPSQYAMALFELAERALGDPDIAMTVVDRHQVGELDLFDYLFTTAGTLREGLETDGRCLHLVTTRLERGVEAETDRETTYSYREAGPGGRGEDLCLQFSVAALYARARAATGRPVRPVRIAFAQSAPRSHRRLAEALRTRHVDFGAPVTTFTFSARDLDLPMRGADPSLARILNRYAASLPAPPPVTWHGHFQRLLARSIEAGSPSLESVAKQMAVSPRTLQRQLAEHGTTWRAELNAARERRAVKARQSGTVSTAALARQLAYSDPRSLRRALRRWDNEATDLFTPS